jgi:hypothetical protein
MASCQSRTQFVAARATSKTFVLWNVLGVLDLAVAM